MKVLLLASNIATSPYYVYPLGLSVVAESLIRNGHEVKQVDFLEKNRSMEALNDTIDSFSPELIGISIRNIDNVNLLNEQRYLDTVKDIISNIRKKINVPVVLGGAGFSIMPEAILEKVGADYGIVGEGEKQLMDLIESISDGKTHKEKCIRRADRLEGDDISGACYDPDLMDFYLKKGNVASLQTKRGCPHHCVYCSYPVLEGSSFRCRDPRKVVDEIELLIKKYGSKFIFFTDSVFNDDNGHYLDIVNEMHKRGINVPWTAFFKPGGIDEESVILMKKTGLAAVELGADAPTDTTLAALGKSFSFKDILSSNDIFVSNGIPTAHYYMFGCPGETVETVFEGIKNITGLKKTVSFIFMGIRILPDTPLARIAKREGIIGSEDDLLDPVYYISPGIDRAWLENTLNDAFKDLRHCVFPPDSLDAGLQFLHKMGYSGALWDMLLSGKKKKRKVISNGTE